MAATLKYTLPAVETELFYNWNDLKDSEIKAANITLCNTSSSSVTVSLAFCVLGGSFSAGLVLSQTSVPAHSTITVEITERIILTDESIRGFASVGGVVVLSIDLFGNIGQDELPVIAI